MTSNFFDRQKIRDTARARMTKMKQRKSKSYQEIEKLSEELYKEHLQQQQTPDLLDEHKRIWKFWLVGVTVVVM